MRIPQKLRCCKWEWIILAGALCLVAVCASAQENTSFSGLPLPLTLTQQFVLTNNLLFASPENQLQNVEIVYAYNPTDLRKVFLKNGLLKNTVSGTPRLCFEIEEDSEPQASGQMESSYKARQLTVEDLQSDDNQSERAGRNVYLAISEDDYNTVLSEMTDPVDSNFMKENAKKFFIFKTQKSVASDDQTINQPKPTDTQS